MDPNILRKEILDESIIVFMYWNDRLIVGSDHFEIEKAMEYIK